jgi:hypothetical protein
MLSCYHVIESNVSADDLSLGAGIQWVLAFILPKTIYFEEVIIWQGNAVLGENIQTFFGEYHCF